MTLKLTARQLGALALIALSGPALSQSARTYQYDARGRLVQVTDGIGAKTSYALDRADNRANLTTQTQFSAAWEAEALYHVIGYADANGWASNVTISPNFMTYGPYSSLPTGSRVGTWRALIDVRNVADNSAVITLDVWDATAGQQLASRTLTRHNWASGMAYQVFELPFNLDSGRTGHAIELRTWYNGAAYVRLDKIGYY